MMEQEPPTYPPFKLRNLQLAVGLITAWTLTIVGSAFWNALSIRGTTLQLATLEAKSSFNKDMLYRAWNSKHGGLYAPVTQETLPNPYLEVEEKTIMTPSGRELTLINPAYMTRQVHALDPERGDFAHLTSLTPIRPANRPDEWEKRALNTFELGASEALEATLIEGKKYLRYMQPFITEESCMKCHESQGYVVGDIRGGLSVSIPLAPYYTNYKKQRNAVLIGHVILWLMGSTALAGGLFLWNRQALRRFREMEDMRENEKKFRILFESSCEAAALLNEEAFVDCNEAALRMFRCFEHEQITGRHPADFSPRHQPDGSDSREQFDALIARALQIGSLQFEWTLRRLDGNEFFAEMIFSALKVDGQPCLQLVMRDISARKKAETQQRASQAETERMNRLMTGREQRILELKQEVNDLLEEANHQPRYTSALGEEE